MRQCAMPQILQTAAELQEQEWEYSMEASCIEIYNNQLRWRGTLASLTAHGDLSHSRASSVQPPFVFLFLPKPCPHTY